MTVKELRDICNTVMETSGPEGSVETLVERDAGLVPAPTEVIVGGVDNETVMFVYQEGVTKKHE